MILKNTLILILFLINIDQSVSVNNDNIPPPKVVLHKKGPFLMNVLEHMDRERSLIHENNAKVQNDIIYKLEKIKSDINQENIMPQKVNSKVFKTVAMTKLDFALEIGLIDSKIHKELKGSIKETIKENSKTPFVKYKIPAKKYTNWRRIILYDIISKRISDSTNFPINKQINTEVLKSMVKDFKTSKMDPSLLTEKYKEINQGLDMFGKAKISKEQFRITHRIIERKYEKKSILDSSYRDRIKKKSLSNKYRTNSPVTNSLLITLQNKLGRPLTKKDNFMIQYAKDAGKYQGKILENYNHFSNTYKDIKNDDKLILLEKQDLKNIKTKIKKDLLEKKTQAKLLERKAKLAQLKKSLPKRPFLSMIHIANSLVHINDEIKERTNKIISGYYRNMDPALAGLELGQELSSTIGQISLDLTLTKQSRFAFASNIFFSGIMVPTLQVFQILYHSPLKFAFTKEESIQRKYKIFSEFSGSRLCVNPIFDQMVSVSYKNQMDSIFGNNITIWTDSIETRLEYQINPLIQYTNKIYVNCFMGNLKHLTGDQSNINLVNNDPENHISTYSINNLNQLFSSAKVLKFTCGKEPNLILEPNEYSKKIKMVETWIDGISSLDSKVCEKQPWRNLIGLISSCKYEPNKKNHIYIPCERLKSDSIIDDKVGIHRSWIDVEKENKSLPIIYDHDNLDQIHIDISKIDKYIRWCSSVDYTKDICLIKFDLNLNHQKVSEFNPSKDQKIKITIPFDINKIGLLCDNLTHTGYFNTGFDRFKIIQVDRKITNRLQCYDSIIELDYVSNKIEIDKWDNYLIENTPVIFDISEDSKDSLNTGFEFEFKSGFPEQILDQFLSPFLTYKNIYIQIQGFAKSGISESLITGNWTSSSQYEKSSIGPIITFFSSSPGCEIIFEIPSNMIRIKCLPYSIKNPKLFDTIIAEVSTGDQFCPNPNIIHMRNLEWCQQTPISKSENISIPRIKTATLLVIDFITSEHFKESKLIDQKSYNEYQRAKKLKSDIKDYILNYFKTLNLIKKNTSLLIDYNPEKMKEFDKFIQDNIDEEIISLVKEKMIQKQIQEDFKEELITCFRFHLRNISLVESPENKFGQEDFETLFKYGDKININQTMISILDLKNSFKNKNGFEKLYSSDPEIITTCLTQTVEVLLKIIQIEKLNKSIRETDLL